METQKIIKTNNSINSQIFSESFFSEKRMICFCTKERERDFGALREGGEYGDSSPEGSPETHQKDASKLTSEEEIEREDISSRAREWIQRTSSPFHSE